VPKSDFIEKLLGLLQDGTSCGFDPVIAKQSKGFVEGFLGMETYSSIMIQGENATKGNYGTRTHSVILVDANDHCTFVEVDRNLDQTWTRTEDDFPLTA